METIGWESFGVHEFKSGAVAVTDDTEWVEILRLRPPNGTTITICGTVGDGGSLGGLKLTQAATQNGAHIDLAVDDDFNEPTYAVPYALGEDGAEDIHLTPAEGSFQIRLESGAAEYVLYAKKATTDTTLTISGTFN
jgi:hypothetical protein